MIITNNCFCCYFKKLYEAIKNINLSCNVDIPQPLEINGTVDCNSNFPQPLQIEGTVTCNTTIPQPLEVTGTINCVSTDSCAESMAKILSQSSSFTEIVLDTGEQYQKVEDVTVNGSIVSFSSQGKKIQTTVCKIEYVVL